MHDNPPQTPTEVLDPGTCWDFLRGVSVGRLGVRVNGYPEVFPVNRRAPHAGIHLGAMAGTIDVVQRSFAGLRFSGDTILFAPNLPTGLRAVAFEVLYRGHLLRVHLKDGDMSIASALGDAGPIKVQVHGIDEVLPPGQTRHFPLPSRGPGVVVP